MTKNNKITNTLISEIFSGFLAAVILIISFLLPLDKGFPEISLTPHFSIPIVFVLILLLFGFIFFKEKIYKNFLQIFQTNFILSQMLILLVLAVATIRTDFFHNAFVYIIHYFCLFVLNFVSFNFLLKNEKIRKILIQIAIFSALIAAFVGIYEFITKSYPPFYRYFIITTDGKDALIPANDSSLLRAAGTQGFHIIYSFLMAISVLLCNFIKNKTYKTLYLFVVSAGCLTGISTTGFIILAILLFSLLFASLASASSRELKKYLFIMTALFLIALVFLVAFPSIRTLLEKLVFGNPQSVEERSLRINWTFDKMLSFIKNDFSKFLFGNGLKSSSPNFTKEVPPPIWWPVGTGRVFALDNEYLVALYETGIIGLLFLLFAWLRLLFGNYLKLNNPAWWLILVYLLGFFGLNLTPYSGINVIFVFLLCLFISKDKKFS